MAAPEFRSGSTHDVRNFDIAHWEQRVQRTFDDPHAWVRLSNMAIFILGKTVCGICGSTIDVKSQMVAMPRMYLPRGLESLAGSCLHRNCLDGFPARADVLEGWKQHWRAQASVPTLRSQTNLHGVALFRPGRFTFGALDTFVDFEEAEDAWGPLREFFTSSDGSRRATLVTTRNTWELDPQVNGTRMTITRNPPPPGTIRDVSDTVRLDYTFNSNHWQHFVRAWSDFS